MKRILMYTKFTKSQLHAMVPDCQTRFIRSVESKELNAAQTTKHHECWITKGCNDDKENRKFVGHYIRIGNIVEEIDSQATNSNENSPRKSFSFASYVSQNRILSKWTENRLAHKCSWPNEFCFTRINFKINLNSIIFFFFVGNNQA